LMVPLMFAFKTGTGLAHAPPTRTVAELPELNWPELKEKKEPMNAYDGGPSSVANVIDAPDPPIDKILLTNVVMVSLALQTLAHMPTDTAENGVPLVAVNVTTPPEPE